MINSHDYCLRCFLEIIDTPTMPMLAGPIHLL
jgi:hypothetical protein